MMDVELRMKRTELFQELKPCCVKLSQLALKNDGSNQSVIENTRQLLEILHHRCRGNTAFDDKLADYVFFPLSHVLRICQKQQQGRLAELATSCLRVLLEDGWRTTAVELGHQFLILLTFFADGGPEELQTAAYGALAALFRNLLNTPQGSASLVNVATIPALGQCLSVILDGITDGPSSMIQWEALLALMSLWTCIKDQGALSNFLPGTISALTKCLVPTTKAPRSRRVLITALDVLQKVLTSILSDVATRNLGDDRTTPGAKDKNTFLTKPWLDATGAQIKLALASIIKLRAHSHNEVQKALSRTCLVILDQCHSSLANSAALLVETVMIISSSVVDERTPQETTLKDLAMIYPSTSELIKGVIYNWVTSLPHVMQASDESAKQSALTQLAKAQDLLSGLEIDSAVLVDALAYSLRNSVVSLLELPTSRAVMLSPVELTTDPSLVLSSQAVSIKQYRPVVMPHRSQTQTREELDKLIAHVGPPDMQIKMANEFLDYLRGSSGNSAFSAFWLSFRLLKAAASVSSELDALTEQNLAESSGQEALMVELYTYSVSTLSDGDGELDWRMQATAMEVVAFIASAWGETFRPDLVDTIYPIVHMLGSSDFNLRDHAIATLNMISGFCGYTSTSEMIVDNVDYLVNAISLKLNTFDISPQAPQVLVMMIRLSGPSLLPYLDDVVDSIFAALDSFHGYPKLVESLFTVLGEIVKEGSQSRQLKLGSSSKVVHRKKRAAGPTIKEVLDLYKSKLKKASAVHEVGHEDFPKEPWKDASTLLDELDRSHEVEEDQDESADISEVQKHQPEKVYSMVQSIARLGQHYLTSSSPLLRQRLLDLISTACGALLEDEDQFLLVVNDIWPVLIKRLYDEEPFVVIAASKTIAQICIGAGDFMSGRVRVEWHDMMKLVRQAKSKANAEKKGHHGRGVYSQNWKVWDSLVNLLVSVIENVRIEDAMFDEVLDILADLLASRKDIRIALSIVNADAVWLEEFRQGQHTNLETPATGEIQFVSLFEDHVLSENPVKLSI